MSARHKKVRKSSITVANRYVVMGLSLGAVLGVGAAVAAPSAMAATGAPTGGGSGTGGSSLAKNLQISPNGQIKSSFSPNLNLKGPGGTQLELKTVDVGGNVFAGSGFVKIDPKLKVTIGGKPFEISGLGAEVTTSYTEKEGRKIEGTLKFAPNVPLPVEGGILQLQGGYAEGKFAFSEKGGWSIEMGGGLNVKAKFTATNGSSIGVEGLDAGTGLKISNGDVAFVGHANIQPKITLGSRDGSSVAFEAGHANMNFEIGTKGVTFKANEGFTPKATYTDPTGRSYTVEGLNAEAGIEAGAEGFKFHAKAGVNPKFTLGDSSGNKTEISLGGVNGVLDISKGTFSAVSSVNVAPTLTLIDGKGNRTPLQLFDAGAHAGLTPDEISAGYHVKVDLLGVDAHGQLSIPLRPPGVPDRQLVPGGKIWDIAGHAVPDPINADFTDKAAQTYGFDNLADARKQAQTDVPNLLSGDGHAPLTAPAFYMVRLLEHDKWTAAGGDDGKEAMSWGYKSLQDALNDAVKQNHHYINNMAGLYNDYGPKQDFLRQIYFKYQPGVDYGKMELVGNQVREGSTYTPIKVWEGIHGTFRGGGAASESAGSGGKPGAGNGQFSEEQITNVMKDFSVPREEAIAYLKQPEIDASQFGAPQPGTFGGLRSWSLESDPKTGESWKVTKDGEGTPVQFYGHGKDGSWHQLMPDSSLKNYDDVQGYVEKDGAWQKVEDPRAFLRGDTNGDGKVDVKDELAGDKKGQDTAQKAKEEADAKAKAEADAKAKEEADAKAKAEADAKAKAEADAKAKEEADRKAKEEADRKAKEEADRKAKEEADRKAKEEADRKAKEEADRKAKEEADRKAKEEADRKAKEEADRKAKEEADRKAKEEADRKAREEADRRAREEADRRAEDHRREERR